MSSILAVSRSNDDMITYFNHDEDSLPLLNIAELLGRTTSLQMLVDLDDCYQWMKDSDIAIIHGSYEGDDEDVDFYDELRNKEVVTRDGLVAIFLSSEPLPLKREPIRFRKDDGSEGVRYLLLVPQTKESGLVPFDFNPLSTIEIVNRWDKLLKVLLDKSKIDAWLSGNADEILDEVFLTTPSSFYLPAMAILCQGYLAFQYTFGDTKTKVQVAKVLTHIGLNDRICADLRQSPIAENASKQLEQISTSHWWITGLGLDRMSGSDDRGWSIFRTRINEEFLRHGNDDIPGSVINLINAFNNQDRAILPEIVIDAYQSIAGAIK